MLLTVVVVFAVSACGDFNPPATTVVTTTTTSTLPSTPTTAPANETVEVYLSQFSSIEPGWSELFFPYGEETEFLGMTATGESIVGPNFGTQTGDGMWWFFDTARLRVARYTEQGVFVDEIPIPEALLNADGAFDHGLPQALDNGRVVATAPREGFTATLTFSGSNVVGSRVGVDAVWGTTDGTALFGLATDGSILRLSPGDSSFAPTPWQMARDGSRYRATVQADQLLVELPDAGVTRTIRMRLSEQPEVAVAFEVQVETGEDGTLFILVSGHPLTEPELGVGGLLTIAADGTVGRIQAIPDLYPAADPGSPGHLGIRPGTSSPWLMVIGDTGVHIYVQLN